MSELEQAHATIRDWFTHHGADERAHRAEMPDEDPSQLRVWSASYGDVDVVFALEALEQGVNLQVNSGVLQVTDDTAPALMPALLRLNREALVGCAFALEDDNQVVIVADREATSLDAAALERLVARVHEAAVTFTPQLARFGAISLLDEEE